MRLSREKSRLSRAYIAQNGPLALLAKRAYGIMNTKNNSQNDHWAPLMSLHMFLWEMFLHTRACNFLQLP